MMMGPLRGGRVVGERGPRALSGRPQHGAFEASACSLTVRGRGQRLRLALRTRRMHRFAPVSNDLLAALGADRGGLAGLCSVRSLRALRVWTPCLPEPLTPSTPLLLGVSATRETEGAVTWTSRADRPSPTRATPQTTSVAVTSRVMPSKGAASRRRGAGRRASACGVGGGKAPRSATTRKPTATTRRSLPHHLPLAPLRAVVDSGETRRPRLRRRRCGAFLRRSRPRHAWRLAQQHARRANPLPVLHRRSFSRRSLCGRIFAENGYVDIDVAEEGRVSARLLGARLCLPVRTKPSR